MLFYLASNNYTVLDKILIICTYAIMLLIVQPIHEFSHAWAAKKLGDDTAEKAGRLTLNPFASLDPVGSLGILLIGFGWGKPVPVDPRNFQNPRRGMGLTSLAGPASNFIFAFLGNIVRVILIIGYNATYSMGLYYGAFVLEQFVSINIVLGVFNLIPVYPLDGEKIFLWLMPRSVGEKYRNFARQYGMFMPMLLFVFIRSSVYDKVLYYVMRFFDFITGFAEPIGNAIFNVS